jgi:signal transduction histidine kinase
MRSRPVPVGAEVALAFTAGVLAFVLVSVPLAATDSEVVAGLLAPLSAAGVVALSRYCGIAYAVPAALTALVAYDWFVFPPTHPAEFPDSANLVNLLAYLAAGALVGELAAYTGRRAVASERALSALAEEQAALRRVATLVAQHAPATDVCGAIAREVGGLLGVDATHMGRYDDGDMVTGVANWSREGDHLPVGTRTSTEGDSVSALVRRTSRPARMDGYEAASGSIAEVLRERGFRSSVGAPVIVDGRLWGVMIASSKAEEPLPDDTEARIAAFTELAATAISNTEAWSETRTLADEQAALRRVATLVARESPPTEIFAMVAEELGHLLRVEGTGIWRYENDGYATAVAAWGKLRVLAAPGTRVPLEEHSIAGRIRSSGRAARVDDYGAMRPAGAAARREGIHTAVRTPIVVDGRLWGAMVLATIGAEPLPADTEARMAGFTGLVATAISNVQARSALAASRARILAATDQERRRVVRDLHDGAQQRLVHTVVTLKLADRELRETQGRAPELVSEALGHAETAMKELRELAHGILPVVLTRGGLRAGVDALAARMPVPVANDVTADRLPRAIEATAYFVVAEALTNVAKHAHAHTAEVAASIDQGVLRVEVRDDGIGGARSDGHGLLGLGDRLAALDGTLRIESAPGGGTLVAAAIPVRHA